MKKRPATGAEGFKQERCVWQRASGQGFSLLATARRFMRCLGLRAAELGRTLRFTSAASGTGAPTHVLGGAHGGTWQST